MLDKQVSEEAPEISEEQARKYYEENIDSYQVPLKIQAQHISEICATWLKT